MKSFIQFVRFRLHTDRRFFRTMLRKNLIIALAAVLISIPLAIYSCITIISREMENVRSTAGFAIEEITGELTMIRNMTTAISEDANIAKLRQMSPLSNSRDYLIARNARDFVDRIASSHDSIEEIFIYFNSSDCLLTSECVFTPSDQMSVIYDFDLSDNLSQNSWSAGTPHLILPCHSLTRYSYTTGMPRNEVTSPVAFCYYMPASRPRSVSFCILLKSSYIIDLFPQFISDQGHILLTNSAGDVLFEYSASGREPAFGWTLSHECNSSAGTLHLELSFPMLGILNMIREVILFFILTILAALIIPIILAYRMTLRQYAPLIEIMQKMEKCGIAIHQAQSKDAFVAECINILTSSRSEALSELNSLHETLHRNTAMLLLNGATRLHPDWTKDFPERYVVVYGCVDLSDTQDSLSDSLLSTVTLEHIVQQLHSGTTLHRLSPDSFAFIYPISNDNSCEPTEVLQKLTSALDAQFRGSLRLSVSQAAHGPENVYSMLEQARTAMLQSSDGSSLIIASESDNQPTMQFQNAVSFYQALIAGDTDQSVRSIRQMTTMDMLSRYGVRDLYEYLSYILCFAARDTGCQPFSRPEPYSVSLAPSQVLYQLERAARDICSYRAAQKLSQTSGQRQAMMDYIHENLSKYDLSVKELGEQFHMSDRAVQAAIYSEAGTTLANYLRTERMNMASRLLLETDMQVNAICDAVGYNTISAFHKAFKRAFGIAPGEYREQAARKTEAEADDEPPESE